MTDFSLSFFKASPDDPVKPTTGTSDGKRPDAPPPNSVVNQSGVPFNIGDSLQVSYSTPSVQEGEQVTEANNANNENNAQSEDLDSELIADIAKNGPGNPVFNENGEIIAYDGPSWQSLQAGISDNENPIKDIISKIIIAQDKYAKGSPQWNNLEKAKEVLEPSVTKMTKQQLAAGYTQATSQNDNVTLDLAYFGTFIEENADKLNDYGFTKDKDVNEKIEKIKQEIDSSKMSRAQKVKLCAEIRHKYGQRAQMLVSKWFDSDIIAAAKKQDVNYKKASPSMNASCSPNEGTRQAWSLYSSSGNPIKG